MSLLHDSPESTTVDSPPLRFRAATVEQALSDARAELGPHVEVVDANRIRRGGVGGFFATDLGVELTIRPASAVEPDDRIVAPSHDRDDDFEQRLADLDRAIHGQAAASGIDRLLDRAADADGFERAATGSRSEPTFAEHLARHLAEPANPHELPRRSRADQEERSSRASVPTGAAPTPGRASGGLAGATASVRHRPPTDIAAPPRSTAPDTDQPGRTMSDSIENVTNPALDRAMSAASRSAPTSAVGTEAADSGGAAPFARVELGHQADLAAEAVGRLIGELARVAPTDGSRVHQLTRLTVSLTAADGSSVEFSAEMNGSHHG